MNTPVIIHRGVPIQAHELPNFSEEALFLSTLIVSFYKFKFNIHDKDIKVNTITKCISFVTVARYHVWKNRDGKLFATSSISRHDSRNTLVSECTIAFSLFYNFGADCRDL